MKLAATLLVLSVLPAGQLLANGESVLPASYDSRQVIPNMPPVSDLGGDGCSAAQTPIDVMEISQAKKGQVPIALSRAYIQACDTTDFPDGPGGGGTFALIFGVANGFARAADFNDQTPASQCDSTKIVAKAASAAYLVQSSPGARAPDDVIKNAVIQYGAVGTAVYIDPLLNYTGGVFADCDGTTPAVDHGVTIVGWDDGGGYWVVRNSWGSIWGEQGYFRIKYGCSGIGADAFYMDAGPSIVN